MDFSYSEEQRMLTDSLRRLVADAWTRPKRRARLGGLDTGAWGSLVELGVGGLMVPEEFGGFGETPATMLAVHQELGRGLVSEPTISSAVMAVTLLGHCKNEALKKRWLSAHAEGDAVLAIGWQEQGERDAQRPLCTRATAIADGYALDGQKILVWHGAAANGVIVSALLEGEPALFMVEQGATGLSYEDFPTFDGGRAATLRFDRVSIGKEQLIAKGEQAQALLALAIDFGITALCAQACGAMAALTDSTIQYLKTRKQFGQPLAAFQVLQHRLGDMLIQSEMGLSMTYAATIGLAEQEPAKRARLVSMAKIEVAAAARFVGESAVQLHGGMGVTDEMEVGDFFKRLTYVELLLGDTNYHLQRLQDLTV
jgi:alkylation response protein AidB-like acyl-CoA dehydrogenase